MYVFLLGNCCWKKFLSTIFSSYSLVKQVLVAHQNEGKSPMKESTVCLHLKQGDTFSEAGVGELYEAKKTF